MRKYIVLSLWALAAAAPAGAFDLSAYAFRRPVEGPAPSNAAPAALELDAAVFAATRADFADLRLLDDAGVETPRYMEKVTRIRRIMTRSTVPAQAQEARPLADNRLEAVFALETNAPAAMGLTILTPLRDFERNVNVWGEATPDTWRLLVTNALIFDRTRHMDLRRVEIGLPANACRRFKLEITAATEAQVQPLERLTRATNVRGGVQETRTTEQLQRSFRVDRVDFWRVDPTIQSTEEVRRDWPLAGFQVTRDSTNHLTVITIPAGDLPLTALKIETPAHNYRRPVEVQIACGTAEHPDWQTVATGRLLDVDLPGCVRHEDTLEFSEQRAGTWRALIHEGDNPPLEISAVRGTGPVYRMLWLTMPGHSYTLYYGASQLEPPSYDLESLLTPVRAGLPVLAWKMGTPQPNLAFKPPAAPPSDRVARWLFWAGIAVMVLFLWRALARTASRVEDQEKRS